MTTPTNDSPTPPPDTNDKSVATQYRVASFCQSKVPADLAAAVDELEELCDSRVFLLLQDDFDTRSSHNGFSDELVDLVLENQEQLKTVSDPIVLINSSGGRADSAYQLARILTRRCGGFQSLVPLWAKSAATLFCLGAKSLYVGDNGQLGPLDAQVEERDKFSPTRRSALEDSQAIQELVANALRAMDQAMSVMLMRRPEGMRVASLLPLAVQFSGSVIEPLIQQLDPIRLGQMYRAIEQGRQYAVRLLRPHYGGLAEEISFRLVKNYPSHGFIIDREEAQAVGLRVEERDDATEEILEKIRPFCGKVSALGFLTPQGPTPA